MRAGSSPGHSAHPVPRFIWGKEHAARDLALLFLHCLTSQPAAQAFPLLFQARCPPVLPQSSRAQGTSQPGTARSCTICYVSLMLTLSLWLSSAFPQHWQLSHGAGSVCHSPSMSPHWPLAAPPASSLPVELPAVLVVLPGLPSLPVPAWQDSTRSWGTSCNPTSCCQLFPEGARGIEGAAETQAGLILLC